MGMFDKPVYLTGENGWASVGDTFFVHNARLDGTRQVRGENRSTAKLQVSDTLDGEKVIVYTSGRAIVGQVQRMDAEDRAAMPIEVRLDEIPPTEEGRNPTNVLTPANQPEPAAAGAAAGEDF